MGSELGVTANSRPEPVLDAVGIWWACWASGWTASVIAGMAFLLSRRHLPALRIRGLGLSLAAVGMLHLYWISVQLGYVLGPLVPGQVEFWIMGVYLPFGIALFHASNSRFLHIAKTQRRYAEKRGADVPVEARPEHGLAGRFRRLEYTTKILVVVGLGMFVQLLLTILMFLISRKWHGDWGIPGTEVRGGEMEQKMEMGRGWEWWPSLFWQFFWAWIVAPVVLWKARGIRDTQGWRFQTVACAIVNLHATPMWLIALYVPAMEPINRYWIPPQWIAVSIMMTEVFTIFLPCCEVMRQQALRKETLDSIAQWESKNQVAMASGTKSLHSASTVVESIMSGWASTNGSVRTNGSGESILTMSALEHVLERRPMPLQEFAALRDFSGENIAFLTNVAEWRNSLPAAVREGGAKDSHARELVLERFDSALRIYAEFISVRDAEFPINISSKDLKQLETVFERAARIMYGDKGEVEPATLFDTPAYSVASSRGSEKLTGEPMASRLMHDRVQFCGEIPDEFDETVFRDAEKSIKYLVLTNTWPKFVKHWRSCLDSVDVMEAGNDVFETARRRFSR
ncbi:Regulator of G protein signaling superfamily [Drechmeria coniospora]|uniref:Regulator of G protein signaling superfamily n=1 Tax=Drechmeria coniospora TaxID=98403 RepID=A0A151GK15_DRECN|nr:Regulator of G protein signaling superfamily [Drechmeria coniospora]KYK57352.1 Regulator of G protein signaling superfamily [Drechmeria coniospora]ODA79246.1 hypothetical protein RJ55_04839 [Drechmeria coniospora]